MGGLGLNANGEIKSFWVQKLKERWGGEEGSKNHGPEIVQPHNDKLEKQEDDKLTSFLIKKHKEFT